MQQDRIMLSRIILLTILSIAWISSFLYIIDKGVWGLISGLVILFSGVLLIKISTMVL